jgi:hypothetical protein
MVRARACEYDVAGSRQLTHPPRGQLQHVCGFVRVQHLIRSYGTRARRRFRISDRR